MKDVGSSASSAGALGLIVGGVIYGSAVLIEKSSSTEGPGTIAVANENSASNQIIITEEVAENVVIQPMTEEVVTTSANLAQ
jgi:hypothetical protein